jgi:hypothetical protein
MTRKVRSSGPMPTPTSSGSAPPTGSPTPTSSPSGSTGPTGTGAPSTGTITVAAASDLQAAVNANPAGTSFLVQCVRTLTAPVLPKAGDGLFADTGASLDGGGTTPHAFTGNQNGIDDAPIPSDKTAAFELTEFLSPQTTIPYLTWLLAET